MHCKAPLQALLNSMFDIKLKVLHEYRRLCYFVKNVSRRKHWRIQLLCLFRWENFGEWSSICQICHYFFLPMISTSYMVTILTRKSLCFMMQLHSLGENMITNLMAPWVTFIPRYPSRTFLTYRNQFNQWSMWAKY